MPQVVLEMYNSLDAQSQISVLDFIAFLAAKKNADPFYGESNMAHLERAVEALNAGQGVEHDLCGA